MSENYSLTPEEVAEILKIKKHTVYELVKRGELPAFRIGRKIRVNPQDVEAFRLQRSGAGALLTTSAPETADIQFQVTGERTVDKGILVISGLDVILDVLARHLETGQQPIQVYRDHRGSFAGLLALYNHQCDAAGIHLWDSETNQYNVPFVRRLLPGLPAVIVHLAKRRQGFYVRSGNPRNITKWEDLGRTDIRFVNREPGCGTRVLLDEKLRQMGISSQGINGYREVETSHLAVASAVARDRADVGLGNEKAAMQVREIEFVPLQTEDYELVLRFEDINKVSMVRMLEVLNSPAFKNEVQGLGDYDLSLTGKITARI
ncbi:MAG: helix-turn-helix transcriptional regulator [Bacillota bacterium]|jgi:putative molybdopterin biosynthesis protein|nr:helix-turn-helix transcriptional regulator [Bacillota bacterium]MDI9480786.1 helix-turn-helix transcriptional regulator [Bacillota bacterium]NLP24157.1 helix-turn-helix transcriptional regulator [Syntrophomonadaceae bacterium]